MESASVPELSNVMDVSSDLESPEPVFNLRPGRMCVSDLDDISQPTGRAEGIAYRSLLQGFITYDEFLTLVHNLRDLYSIFRTDNLEHSLQVLAFMAVQRRFCQISAFIRG